VPLAGGSVAAPPVVGLGGTPRQIPGGDRAVTSRKSALESLSIVGRKISKAAGAARDLITFQVRRKKVPEGMPALGPAAAPAAPFVERLFVPCEYKSLGQLAKSRRGRGTVLLEDEGAVEEALQSGTSGRRRVRSLFRAIHPDGVLRRVWDLIQLVLIVYISIAVPVRVGFDKAAYGGWFIFDLLVDLFFVFDIVLNFLTAYEDENGDLRCAHKEIAGHYTATWLFLDLLAAFPVDYIVRAAEGELACSFSSCPSSVFEAATATQPRLFKLFRGLRITRLFKLLRLARITKLLEKYQAIFFVILPAIGISRQIIVLGFLGHLLGCFFYYFSSTTWQREVEKQLIAEGVLENWILWEFQGEEYEIAAVDGFCPAGYRFSAASKTCHTMYSLGLRYVSSLYWAFTTMTTVGYGDISATTMSERIYNVFALIIGGLVFSGIISRMGNILSSFDAATKAQAERMETVKVFLRDTKMPAALRAPVLAFFKKQRVKSYDTRQVLGQLPFELRSRVVKHLYEEDIKNAPVLGFRRDDIFITDLCMRIQMYSVSAYTYVYQSGETGSDVFILLRGDLVLVDVDRDTIICQLKEGAMFGVSGVLEVIHGKDYRPRRKENLYCLSGCDLLKISLEDFLEIVITYPDILGPLEEYFTDLTKLTRTVKSKLLSGAVNAWATSTAAGNASFTRPGNVAAASRSGRVVGERNSHSRGGGDEQAARSGTGSAAVAVAGGREGLLRIGAGVSQRTLDQIQARNQDGKFSSMVAGDHGASSVIESGR